MQHLSDEGTITATETMHLGSGDGIYALQHELLEPGTVHLFLQGYESLIKVVLGRLPELLYGCTNGRIYQAN